jgi:hypothetical protein
MTDTKFRVGDRVQYHYPASRDYFGMVTEVEPSGRTTVKMEAVGQWSTTGNLYRVFNNDGVGNDGKITLVKRPCQFQVGDEGKYVNQKGTILLHSEGSKVVEVTANRIKVKLPNEGYRSFDLEGNGVGWKYGCDNSSDVGSKFILAKKADDIMFTFKPGTTIPTVSAVIYAHIDGVIENGKYGVGRTIGVKTYEKTGGVQTIWDQTGKQVFRAPGAEYENRTLVHPKSDAQIQYEKLDVDGRGIVAALQNNTTAQINYVKDKLKVDVNLAHAVIAHAFIMGYK